MVEWTFFFPPPYIYVCVCVCVCVCYTLHIQFLYNIINIHTTYFNTTTIKKERKKVNFVDVTGIIFVFLRKSKFRKYENLGFTCVTSRNLGRV
jgi:hypothetical protein